MTDQPTITIDLPTRFLDDREGRDLPIGNVIKRLKTTTRTELDRATYDDILSDADYYSDATDFDWTYDTNIRGVILSARATLKRLQAVEPPAAAEPVAEPAEAEQPEDEPVATFTIRTVDGIERTAPDIAAVRSTYRAFCRDTGHDAAAFVFDSTGTVAGIVAPSGKFTWYATASYLGSA